MTSITRDYLTKPDLQSHQRVLKITNLEVLFCAGNNSLLFEQSSVGTLFEAPIEKTNRDYAVTLRTERTLTWIKVGDTETDSYIDSLKPLELLKASFTVFNQANQNHFQLFYFQFLSRAFRK